MHPHPNAQVEFGPKIFFFPLRNERKIAKISYSKIYFVLKVFGNAKNVRQILRKMPRKPVLVRYFNLGIFSHRIFFGLSCFEIFFISYTFVNFCQCCGSESVIRYLFYPSIRERKKIKIRIRIWDEHPGSYFLELRNNFFG
jgi:hypothetical protein